jgi:hypothetical protein
LWLLPWLQPLFGLSQLAELVLAKNAYLFLGEICLGDSALAAAAGLRGLAKLDLSTIRVQDEGFASLTALSHLTHLSLRGQVNVTLGVLAQVFSITTKLEELNLGCLVPSNCDLKRIAAAHAGNRRSQSSRRQAAEQRRAARRQLAQQLQQQQALTAQLLQQEQAVQSAAAAAAGTSSRASSSSAVVISTDPAAAAAVGLPQSSEADARVGSGTRRSSSLSRSSNSSNRSSRSSSIASSSSSSSSSSSVVRFSGDDWSTVLLPLQRLRRLSLQSDLVLLGSCAALRGMACITHLELHGGAKLLSAGHFAALPSSWLSQLASTSAAAEAAADGNGSSSPTEREAAAARVLRGRVPSSSCLVSAHGAWPALKSLQVDNLQLADDFVEGVRQLASLRTLIVSGPCLLAQPQQQQQQQQVVGNVPVQRRQQQPQELTSSPASLLQQQQPQRQGHGSSSSAEIQPPSSSSADASRRQAMQLQQQFPAGLFELRSLSGLMQQPQDFWTAGSTQHKAAQQSVTAPSLTSAAIGVEHQAISSPHSRSSDSAPASPPAAAVGAAAAVGVVTSASGLPELAVQALADHTGAIDGLAGLGFDQQQQQAAQLTADLDMLSRLSPLEQLSCFQLHLQQHMPRGECSKYCVCWCVWLAWPQWLLQLCLNGVM